MIFGFNTDVKVGTVVYHVQSEARQKDLLLQTQVFVRGQCIGKCTSPFPEEPVLLDFAEDSIQQALKTQHRRIVDAARAGSVEQELAGVVTFLAEPGTADVTVASEAIASMDHIQAAAPLEFPVLETPTPGMQSDAVKSEPVHLDLEQALAAAVNAVTAPVSATAPARLAPPYSDEPIGDPAPRQKRDPLVALPQGFSTGSMKIECTEAQWMPDEQSLLLVLQVHVEDVPVECAALTLRLACGSERPRYAYSSTDGNGVAALSITLEDTSAVEGKLLVQAENAGESATRRFQLQPLTTS